jgi:tRNA modification GTPase
LATARAASIAACATATGGRAALLRLSGPEAFRIADAAGFADAPRIPCRVLRRRGPRTATGHDLIEILLPGAPDLVELALAALVAAGARRAGPGDFTRQAVACGRLTLDRAAAVLALAQAGDARAAREALGRLRGSLAEDLEPVRERLLGLRARIEAGLDFLDEHDVVAPERGGLAAELAELAARIDRWRVAADAVEGRPLACLVGAPNAGKSALFAALSGEAALVSPVAGTTRDHLEADLDLDGLAVRLADTPGWLDEATGLDARAVAAGRSLAAVATVVLACAAPDAPLPAALPGDPARTVVIATKADLGAAADPRAVLAVSAEDGTGLDALRGLIARLAAAAGGGDPRQGRLIDAAREDLRRARALPADELLADDLRRASERLGDLLGRTTPDDVLDAIFARFCIGK